MSSIDQTTRDARNLYNRLYYARNRLTILERRRELRLLRRIPEPEPEPSQPEPLETFEIVLNPDFMDDDTADTLDMPTIEYFKDLMDDTDDQPEPPSPEPEHEDYGDETMRTIILNMQALSREIDDLKRKSRALEAARYERVDAFEDLGSNLM